MNFSNLICHFLTLILPSDYIILPNWSFTPALTKCDIKMGCQNFNNNYAVAIENIYTHNDITVLA